jgi:hypothetical protein
MRRNDLLNIAALFLGSQSRINPLAGRGEPEIHSDGASARHHCVIKEQHFRTAEADFNPGQRGNGDTAYVMSYTDSRAGGFHQWENPINGHPSGVWATCMRTKRGAFMQSIVKLAMVAAISAMVGTSAAAQERAQVGDLTCDIAGGLGLVFASQKTLNCTFMPSVPGPVEYYTGTLTKLGVDIGATAGGVMVWLVYAPSSRSAGALSGRYGGATAEASVGAGVGANVLVGGSNQAVELQPVSLQGQTGLNVAAGVAGIDLQWVK